MKSEKSDWPVGPYMYSMDRIHSDNTVTQVCSWGIPAVMFCHVHGFIFSDVVDCHETIECDRTTT
jgi:hypothetical protein